MIYYVLGVITGIVLCTILGIIELELLRRGTSVSNEVLKKIVAAPKGAVLMPLTDLQESIAKKIEENDSKGRDTPLSDL